MSGDRRARQRDHAKRHYRRNKAAVEQPPAMVLMTPYYTDIPIENPQDLRYEQTLRVPAYRVGDLAKVLGKSPQSVRLWTQQGILPELLFRSGDGNRIYTYDQVRAVWERIPLLGEVDEEGRENWRFAQELRQLWAAMPDGVRPQGKAGDAEPTGDAKVASHSAIYALTDPRDGRRYYAGRAIDPEKRKEQHVDLAWRKAFRGKALDLKEQWLFELEQEGLEPGLEILEEHVPKAFVRAREEQWIKRLRLEGEPLFNTYPLEDGQDG